MLGAIVNVVLNLILIPPFGALGAAWATLVAYAVAVYLTTLLFRPLRSASIHMTRALVAPLRIGSIARAARRGAESSAT